MILTVIQAVIWLVIIPCILGKFFDKKGQETNRILYTWLIGTLLMMAIFTVIAIPMVLLKADFKALRNTYFVVIVFLSALSIILNKCRFFKLNNPKSISIFQVIAIVLVILQVFIRVKYSTVNNDDSSFVVLSTQMIENGRMYIDEEEKLIARRALAPISAYYACISQYLFMHVTIVTHTVVPVLVVCLANVVYYYLGKKLFNNDKESTYIFMIFMSILNLYFFRFKGAGAYLLKFPWFGRGIVAGIIIPFLWVTLLETMNEENNKIKNWMKILVIVLASCLCSEMAIAIVSMPLMILGLVGAIIDKKPSYLLKAFLTVLPCLILALIYINIS